MSGIGVSPVWRRRLSLLIGTGLVGLSGLGFVGCSGGSPTETQNALIGVQTSQLSVTVENKAGMPVTDVDVAILPLGGATAFRKSVSRMENGEKREFALGDFFGDDGTPFNLRVVRPKAVRVTAKDLNNKPVTAEMPWK